MKSRRSPPQCGNIFRTAARLLLSNNNTHCALKLIMHAIIFDIKHGSISVDSAPIGVDEKGFLARPIAKLCSSRIQKDAGRIQYRLLRKSSVFGKSADVVIEVREEMVYNVTFLFDLIEFFESNVLESTILEAFEKFLNVNFMSTHPSSAFLKPFEWGQAIFFYDAKQGDLSLEITFQENR